MTFAREMAEGYLGSYADKPFGVVTYGEQCESAVEHAIEYAAQIMQNGAGCDAPRKHPDNCECRSRAAVIRSITRPLIP